MAIATRFRPFFPALCAPFTPSGESLPLANLRNNQNQKILFAPLINRLDYLKDLDILAGV